MEELSNWDGDQMVPKAKIIDYLTIQKKFADNSLKRIYIFFITYYIPGETMNSNSLFFHGGYQSIFQPNNREPIFLTPVFLCSGIIIILL